MFPGARLLVVPAMRCRFPRARSLKHMTAIPHPIRTIVFIVRKGLITFVCVPTNRLVVQNIMEVFPAQRKLL